MYDIGDLDAELDPQILCVDTNSMMYALQEYRRQVRGTSAVLLSIISHRGKRENASRV